jgi:hypothetical protein
MIINLIKLCFFKLQYKLVTRLKMVLDITNHV